MCQRISLPWQDDPFLGWDVKTRSLVPEIACRAGQRSHDTLIHPGIQVGCQWKLTRSYKQSTPHLSCFLSGVDKPDALLRESASRQAIGHYTVRRSIGRKTWQLFRWRFCRNCRGLAWNENICPSFVFIFDLLIVAFLWTVHLTIYE